MIQRGCGKILQKCIIATAMIWHLLLLQRLDRIQHYTWRYFDEHDPMYQHDDYLSGFILKTIRFFDCCIQETIKKMKPDDNLIVISDHGFRQRPFHLINMNEVFRQAGLLEVNKSAKKPMAVMKQNLRLLPSGPFQNCIC